MTIAKDKNAKHVQEEMQLERKALMIHFLRIGLKTNLCDFSIANFRFRRKPL